MKQAIKKGARCMASLCGPWMACTVTRCHDDGTYDVTPVGEDDDGLETWQSLTAPEISIDDEAQWPRVFDALRGASPGIGWPEAAAALARLGMPIDEVSFREYWVTNCAKTFEVKRNEAETMRLDRAQSYRFFTWAGYSARLLGDPTADPHKDLFKLYWNNVRMGGRDPAEIGRAITLQDALSALGLAGAAVDPEAERALLLFEKTNRVALPAALKALWSRVDAARALRDAHPNNPVPVGPSDFRLVRSETGRWDAPCALKILDPHQGEHAWWAVFEPGAQDACVWVSVEEAGLPVKRVARSLAFFFWDLCETRKRF